MRGSEGWRCCCWEEGGSKGEEEEGVWKVGGGEVVVVVGLGRVGVERVIGLGRVVLPGPGDRLFLLLLLLPLGWEDDWPRGLRGEALRRRGGLGPLPLALPLTVGRKLSRLALLAIELRQDRMRSEVGGLRLKLGLGLVSEFRLDRLLLRVATELLRPSIFFEKVDDASQESLRRFL